MGKIIVKDQTYGNGPVTVYKGGELSLRYFTRRGHFNLLSNEESYSCHIAVYEDGQKILSTNTSPDYEVDGFEPYYAIQELERSIEDTWISTEKPQWVKVKNFIERYEEQIDHGNDLKELEDVNAKLKVLTERRARLEARI